MSNLKSLKNIIENYSEELKYLPHSEIENLQALLKDIKDRPKSIWDLDIDNGQEYYCLFNDGQISRLSFLDVYDKNTRDIGNAFLTREEAEFDVERRKVESIIKRYSRPFKYDEYNYYIVCDKRYNKIEFLENHYVYNGLSYFESTEIARKVVDEIGEDRLKKYWFGIK